jgi:flavin reductase (DIM6/NTAB) family NADH-FMN oxidoreductase RutF
MSTNNNERKDEWIHLQDKKSFSRLLYTNPVCFLSTVNTKISHHDLKEEDKTQDSCLSFHRNVMVVSWLTATNNFGRFVMSIHKRRYTAGILMEQWCRKDKIQQEDSEKGPSHHRHQYYHHGEAVEFGLSVPIQGMEDLVCNVGRASGRWISSKFPFDLSRQECCHDTRNDHGQDIDTHASSMETHEHWQNNKRKKNQYEHGIDGLTAVRLGCTSEAPQHDGDVFAIQGTIAHLHCRIYQIVGGVDGNVIDEDHHLILAEVVDAYVHKDYWNVEKKQFRINAPSNPHGNTVALPPPYMTFYGSQSFGYVMP